MHIGILINDREYREALVERLLSYNNDLLVSVINGHDAFSKDSIILTDIDPDSLEKELLAKLTPRTVFLSPLIKEDNVRLEYHTLFKYCSVTDLLSEASLVYREYHGGGFERDHSAKIISVCFENDAATYDKCMSLARQIIYRRGDRVLVISLSYINDYGCDEIGDINRFARMMYSISTGRNDASYGFTYTDSYGVSSLMLRKGRNPLAYLDEEGLESVITSAAFLFDTLILDIGTCFRDENLILIDNSDSIVFFENGRRSIDLSELIGKKDLSSMITIKQAGGTDEATAIDDAVNRIYGEYENANEKDRYDR